MVGVKLVVVLSALLQLSAAYDVHPFTWKTIEEAENHATTAVASLYASSVRLQQSVKERVSAPDLAERKPQPEPETCIPQHQEVAPSFSTLVLTLLAVTAAFLLGWLGGTRQAESSQALQQARAADEAEAVAIEHEAAAELAASSVPATLVPVPDSRQPPQTFDAEAQDQPELQTFAATTASDQWSSPDGSAGDVESLQADHSEQASLEICLLTLLSGGTSLHLAAT